MGWEQGKNTIQQMKSNKTSNEDVIKIRSSILRKKEMCTTTFRFTMDELVHIFDIHPKNGRLND